MLSLSGAVLEVPVVVLPLCCSAAVLSFCGLVQKYSGPYNICADLQGEVLLGDLARAGFDIVNEQVGTDAVVVNTCAFVEDAKAESLQV